MLNKTYLIGNLGQAPEIRVMQDGREIASLSLATNSSWKDKQGEWNQHTEWHRVTVFQDFYVSWIKNSVKKGDTLLVEGKLSYSEWEDNSKTKRKVAHIVVYGREGRVHLMNSRKKEASKENSFEERITKPFLEEISIPSETLPSSPFEIHEEEAQGLLTTNKTPPQNLFFLNSSLSSDGEEDHENQ
jgi:single-strand DNA-binding protein